MVGRAVGSYRVTRKLAEGGMGAVYVGEHTVMGREAVVKVLLPELSVNKEMVSRFFNEARAAASIHHPGIVEVFDVGFLEGQAFIVMEKLRGETLAARLLRTKKLPLDRARALIRQLAGALAAAHQGGIVHRDLKPDNIFLVPDPEVPGGERVKVLDFGIAKLSTGAGSVATKAGSIFGTPAYMAPEQCRDAADVDHRADVYAIGCIFYELLTGRPPFGHGGIELLASHLRDTPQSPATLDPTIPPVIAAMVVAMLAKEPAHRYQSCESFVAALDQALPPTHPPHGTLPGQSLAHSPTAAPKVLTTHSAAAAELVSPPDPAPRRRFRLVALGAGAGLLLGTGAVIAFFLLRAGKRAEPVMKPEPTALPMSAAYTPDASLVVANVWVRIEPPSGRVLLGVAASDAPDGVTGFRPQRAIAAPTAFYELQQHEVTWAELDPWLAGHPELAVRPPEWLPSDPTLRARLPATGVPWTAAYEYCRSLGGALPTEEQWELAARGPGLRPAAWGDARLDPVLTHAFTGDPPAAGGAANIGAGALAPVMTSDQDLTPPQAGQPPIHDLMGNAREWTTDVWREDRPEQDDAWTVEGGMTYRAVRGLPLFGVAPPALQRELAAYREPLCATGSCLDKAWELLHGVGFRCARPLR